MESDRPLIGITTRMDQNSTSCCLRREYVTAVHQLGGKVMMLLACEHDPKDIIDQVDGLIFTGGGDIEPSLYNGADHPSIYNVDCQRDYFELSLAKLGLAHNKPLLGICRGLEILVVASGGDLVTHLPDQFGELVTHRTDQESPAQHLVKITPNSQLSQIMGSLEVNTYSWHHQAVCTVPPVWCVAAQAEDGVIEALEHNHHVWAIGLQWHPELAPNDPYQQRIFQAFIQAATHPELTINARAMNSLGANI